jgi:hypothetical protein
VSRNPRRQVHPSGSPSYWPGSPGQPCRAYIDTIFASKPGNRRAECAESIWRSPRRLR